MGELAALIAALTWSCTSVALTSLATRTSPVALSALRLTAATIVLPFVLIAAGQVGDLQHATAGQLAAVIGSGLIGYGIGDTFYIRSLNVLGMQRAFPISQSLFIVLTVVGGIVLLDEPFKWGLVAGAVLIGAGALLVVLRAAEEGRPRVLAVDEAVVVVGGGEPPPPLAPAADVPRGHAPDARAIEGYLLLLTVGVTWAAATLWLAGGRGDLPAVAAGVVRTPAGAVALMAFGLAFQRHEIIAPFHSARRLAAIAAAGLAGTAFGSLLYVYAVLEAGAARTAVLSATAPLLALPLSVLFLKERVTTRIAAGTVLCVAGIVLVVT